MNDRFRVDGIDHVELFVPDRAAAIEWYGDVFGLEVREAFGRWSDTGGPVILSGEDETKLALFEGEPQGEREPVGLRRVAFRVSGEAFLTFLERAGSLTLSEPDGGRLGRARVVDHELSFSIYFCDPYGNRLELTTYEYDVVADELEGGSVRPR